MVVVSVAFSVVTVLGTTVVEITRVGTVVVDSDTTDVTDATSVVMAFPRLSVVDVGTEVLLTVAT